MEDNSAFIIAYMACVFSGGVTGLFIGWFIWG